MYWTPAKMLLLANVGEYSFTNAGTFKQEFETQLENESIPR